ncbi:unnamed protein product [Pipistrellus nathusii]|uniref:Uncharacterized protein n=1 Tax=Pipistrellus nathusii TaxID=59473 RepID=A0ABP0ALB3_PIPNA
MSLKPALIGLLLLGWGLERGRSCPGLGQHAVHFDPGSLPARLLTDCHLSVLAGTPRVAMEGTGPYTIHLHTASWPAAHLSARWERESGKPSLFQVAVGRHFVFVSVVICVNTSLFLEKK